MDISPFVFEPVNSVAWIEEHSSAIGIRSISQGLVLIKLLPAKVYASLRVEGRCRSEEVFLTLHVAHKIIDCYEVLPQGSVISICWISVDTDTRHLHRLKEVF